MKLQANCPTLTSLLGEHTCSQARCWESWDRGIGSNDSNLHGIKWGPLLTHLKVQTSNQKSQHGNKIFWTVL